MKKKGDIGEVIALKYLQSHAYKILATNYIFHHFGEIDIIAGKGEKIVFCEVKYRENLKYGFPEESISHMKLKRCFKTAQNFCMKHKYEYERMQFDVLSILKMQEKYRITHYKNIEI